MTSSNHSTWWRHQIGTFSALLAICAGNSPVPGEFPTQRPVTRSFDVFFDLRLKKRLSKQWWGWWIETLSRPFWLHRNDCLILSCRVYHHQTKVLIGIWSSRRLKRYLKRCRFVRNSGGGTSYNGKLYLISAALASHVMQSNIEARRYSRQSINHPCNMAITRVGYTWHPNLQIHDMFCLRWQALITLSFVHWANDLKIGSALFLLFYQYTSNGRIIWFTFFIHIK